MKKPIELVAVRLLLGGILLLGALFSDAHGAPADISRESLTVWLEADAGITADKDGNVSQWIDQSPTAPAPGTAHPVVKAETWNGKPALHFEQTPFVTIDQVINGKSDFSLLLVRSLDQRPTAASSSANSDDERLRLEITESMRRKSDYQPAAPESNPRTSNPELISVIREGATVKYFVNGEPVATPDSSLTNLAGVSAAQAIFSGDIAEVVLYSRELAHGERVRVEKYLADKYGAYHPNATWMQAFAPNVQDQIDASQWNIDQARAYAGFIAEAGPVTPEGLTVWLRADKGVQADDHNAVTAWRDQSPAGNHFYLPANLPPPAVVAGSINGQPSVRFDGNTHLESTNVATASQDFSVFVVSSLESSGGPFFNGDSAKNGWGFYRSDQSGTYGLLFGCNGEPTFGPIQNPDKPQLLTVTRNAGVVQFYVFGKSAGSLNNPMNAPSPTATVGGLDNGANFTGNVAELLVYNRALNDAERAKTETYLMTKYDLPSSATNAPPVTPPLPK